MFGPVQIFGGGRRRVFGMKHFSCALPLDFIRRAPSLNHRHETSWWRELFFLVSRLPWLAMLDCSSLVTLLDHVRRRIGRWRWSIVSYRTGYWLLCLHPLLKHSTKTEKFPALDEEMRRSLDAIFIEVSVPCAPSIEHLFC
jgi:hypothetical protein